MAQGRGKENLEKILGQCTDNGGPYRRAGDVGDAHGATEDFDGRRALRSDPPPRGFLSDGAEARRRTVEADRLGRLPRTQKSAPRPIGQTPPPTLRRRAA